MAAPRSGWMHVADRGGEGGAMLELEEVVKHYHSLGEEVRAVDGVSLQLQAGEMLALHGPSGSGKTTLLLLIAAIMRPESGTIRFCGIDLAKLSRGQSAEYLRREVGFIHQRFHLMGRVSALENAAVDLGLADRFQHTPESLSGGERQRLAIARVLAKAPRLILADEPTGNLDSVKSREIVELLAQIAHERSAAVLLVTHDIEAASLADRRMVLRDGRLVGASGEAEARALLAGQGRLQDEGRSEER
jgi:putative ABC transport system ATP-binding protein